MAGENEPTELLNRLPDGARTDGTSVEDDPIELDDRSIGDDEERYHMLGTLAEGGMGDILLAKDTRIARQVAIKVLKAELQRKREFRSRFLQEARLQGQLEHPAIVPVHDLGERPGGELFFSMKCVRGVTLLEALRVVQRGEQAARFSRRRLLTAFSSVCLAVDFAHSRGVVHRDLKPSNIMLGDFGEVYVLDWGIAKLVDAPETPVDQLLEIPGSAHATHVGKILGTPEFMAPERVRQGVADRRTDVYALGIILDQVLLAGGRDVPPELEEIVDAATAREPEERIATARQLHELIESYLDGDRDLELRRTQAEEHARHAEEAITTPTPNARTEAGRAIGRALGLDPSNERAMQMLMRLLTEVPKKMPPAAQAALDRAWHARRTRTLRSSAFLAGSVLLYAPFILWLGVRDWTWFAVWLALTLAAPISHLFASRDERTLPFTLAIICAFGGALVLTTSMGLTGFIPAALGVIGVAWRVMLRRWYQGVFVFLAIVAAICAPFFLPAIGFMPAMYTVHDDTLVMTSHLHHFPPVATQVALIMGTVGAAAGAVVFGRLYANEIRRAEERLTFQAWQLQQLTAAD